jgi:hypothetical protein
MAEEYDGEMPRQVVLAGAYELLASSEARGAQETNCRSPQGTGQGNFFRPVLMVEE